MSLDIKPNASLTFILTTLIELDKNIDIELYLLTNENKQLFHVGSLIISIDDLMNPNNERVLNLNALEDQPSSSENFHLFEICFSLGNSLMYQQAFIYLNTLFRMDVKIESTSSFHFIEHFTQLLENIGFKNIFNIPNVYLRVNRGNIFEHVLIHIVNEDDFIVHFYAE
jgi:hypothetical protein